MLPVARYIAWRYNAYNIRSALRKIYDFLVIDISCRCVVKRVPCVLAPNRDASVSWLTAICGHQQMACLSWEKAHCCGQWLNTRILKPLCRTRVILPVRDCLRPAMCLALCGGTTTGMRRGTLNTSIYVLWETHNFLLKFASSGRSLKVCTHLLLWIPWFERNARIFYAYSLMYMLSLGGCFTCRGWGAVAVSGVS